MTGVAARGPRPRPVEVAYWLWLACAALLVLLGLLALTASGAAVREQLVSGGADAANVDALVTLLRGSGGLALAVGVGIGFLAGPVRAGDRRFRRAVVTLSVVYTAVQVLAMAVGVGQLPTLLVSLGAVTASGLVYQRSAAGWFAGG